MSCTGIRSREVVDLTRQVRRIHLDQTFQSMVFLHERDRDRWDDDGLLTILLAAELDVESMVGVFLAFAPIGLIRLDEVLDGSFSDVFRRRLVQIRVSFRYVAAGHEPVFQPDLRKSVYFLVANALESVVVGLSYGAKPFPQDFSASSVGLQSDLMARVRFLFLGFRILGFRTFLPAGFLPVRSRYR